MARKAAKTGPGPTFMVALEQHFPENARIINGDLARLILPFGARISLWVNLRFISVDKMVKWTEKKMPGMWSGFMCRKRYIDDKVADTAGVQTGAVVNLGAGFDTRAYRIPALSRLPVWEVDQPANIKAKQKRLKKVLGDIPKNVTLVPVDFDHEGLGVVLQSYGYSSNVSTFFIWEAVTQYLPEISINATFDFLAKAPAGSCLIFTYVRKDFVDGRELYGHKYLYEKMVLKGRSWLSGMNPEEIADFLSGYGWQLLEHLGYDELAERYVKPTGRKLLSTPLERIVYAEKSWVSASTPSPA